MTKLDDALLTIRQLAFDTPPIIYFVERHTKYIDLVREVLRRLDQGLFIGHTSVITLTEVLTLPKRLGNTVIEQAYCDLLLNSRHFSLLPIDTPAAEIAADLRARYNLRTPDALQIAAALSAGCEAFLTNDATLKRVTELRILILDELAL